MPQVDSLGDYGDPTVLIGNVKIEQGANIAITRDDAHNSLIIASTCPPPPPSGITCTLSHPGPGAPSPALNIPGLAYSVATYKTFQVAASLDDCEAWWNGDTGAWVFSLTRGGQTVGYYGNSEYKIGGGIRFLNVTIPPGATITKAYLTITVRDAISAVVVNTKIRGEANDNPPTFTDYPNYSARPRTAAVVPWSAIPPWATDEQHNSPEIKTIIQEIINRPGWNSGNALVIFWDDHDDESTHAAARYRQGWSYNDNPTKCTKLTIAYTT